MDANKTPFIIAISGDPVSGKSSSIKKLMGMYKADGYKTEEDDINKEDKVIVKVSAGQLFRGIAESTGIKLADLTEYAKKKGNTMRGLCQIVPNKEFFQSLTEEELSQSVDNFTDTHILNLIEEKTEQYKENKDAIIIADARIAGLFMKRDGKEVFTARFALQPEIAAERLVADAANRVEEVGENVTYKGAVKSVAARRTAERERFKSIYDLDLYDMNNYDIVVNTAGISQDKLVSFFYSQIKLVREGHEINKYWRSTKYIKPGREVTDDMPSPQHASCIRVNGIYYAITGQDKIGLSNQNGYDVEKTTTDRWQKESGYELVTYTLLGADDEVLRNEDGEPIQKGLTAKKYYQRFIKPKERKNMARFQKKFKFTYQEPGRAKDQMQR